MAPKFSNNGPIYYTHKEIADMVGFKFKKFQRWSKEIDLNLGRCRIHEDLLPDIKEKFRLLALKKAQKQPPNEG
jgi:hypothetical protein